MGLSYRVRDGTGRFPHAITTGNLPHPPHPTTHHLGSSGVVWVETFGRFPMTTMETQSFFCQPHTQPHAPPTRGPVCGVVGGQPHSEREHHTDDCCVCISFRCISTSQLHALQRFHTWPINPVVYWAPHTPQRGSGNLISEQASRLDAFSGYQSRT